MHIYKYICIRIYVFFIALATHASWGRRRPSSRACPRGFGGAGSTRGPPQRPRGSPRSGSDAPLPCTLPPLGEHKKKSLLGHCMISQKNNVTKQIDNDFKKYILLYIFTKLLYT